LNSTLAGEWGLSLHLESQAGGATGQLRRLTARSVIRKRIVAATRGNGRDAPKAATSMEL
jgi:hypothetical protein